MGEAIRGIALPFIGTTLGAAVVFFMRGTFPESLRRALTGFAAGVMTAASVWSLLLPAIDRSAGLGGWAFLPATGGFWLGVLFLLLLDGAARRLCAAGGGARLQKQTLLMLAVTIHNVPEGMAVGAVYAGRLTGQGGVTALGALSLALGIAVQNLPEGAIISMPLRASGASCRGAFLRGALSGAVEPVGAALMLALAGPLTPAMPWCLSFAAGAMLYVVASELIPDASRGARPGIGAVVFAAGFTVMMALDVALG